MEEYKTHIASPTHTTHGHMPTGLMHDLPHLDMLSELNRLEQHCALRVIVLRHSPGGLNLSSV